MKQNVGSVDRVARVLLALVLLVLNFALPLTGVVSVIAIVLAVVFLLTAVVSFCPLYALFNLNTKKA